MKILFIALLSLVSVNLIAQVTSPLLTDTKGNIITSKKYGDITGSPYLFDYWARGTVKNSSGKITREILLKYDLAGENLLFQTSTGDSMYFAEPIIEFEILPNNSTIPLKFTSGFPKDVKASISGYIANISIGKISLYKKYNISTIESKGYGGNAINKAFNPSTTYYILKDGILNKINPSKKSFTTLFSNNEKQISDFIMDNKIDFKKDDDLKKLIDHINGLN